MKSNTKKKGATGDARCARVSREIELMATFNNWERRGAPLSRYLPLEDARSPESRSTFPLRNVPRFFLR